MLDRPWCNKQAPRNVFGIARIRVPLVYLPLPSTLNDLLFLSHILTSSTEFGNHKVDMVELRKRKTPPPAAPKPAKKATKQAKPDVQPKKTAAQSNGAAATNKTAKAVDVKKPAATSTAAATKTSQTKSGPPKVDDTIDIEGFGGEIETHDGDKTTLKALVEKSKAGIVLFTYPKASTPGCKSFINCHHTTQTASITDHYQAPLKSACSETRTVLSPPRDSISTDSAGIHPRPTPRLRLNRTCRMPCCATKLQP